MMIEVFLRWSLFAGGDAFISICVWQVNLELLTYSMVNSENT